MVAGTNSMRERIACMNTGCMRSLHVSHSHQFVQKHVITISCIIVVPARAMHQAYYASGCSHGHAPCTMCSLVIHQGTGMHESIAMVVRTGSRHN